MNNVTPCRFLLGLFIPRAGFRASPITIHHRTLAYQPHDAAFDPDELAEARKWMKSLQPASLPKGATTFSRSSGPGGQHVNKTESKATTRWTIPELAKVVPKLLHNELRSSKYYMRRDDCISVQAQTQRSRTANADENHEKLFDELQRIYNEIVPGESNPDTKQKYDALGKSHNERRIQTKRHQASKKASRRGRGDE